MSDDSFGDRMKAYEGAEVGRRLMPLVPAIARIDGRGFSKFTRGLERPFDARLSRAMLETTKVLVQESGARVGYTQSDEISLAWYEPDSKREIFFGGRIQKMVSVLAALATVEFNRSLGLELSDYIDRRPVFDCRVWSVPNLAEAANAFLWRERDATKNSIGMAARAYFSHDEVHGRSGAELQDMLHTKGVNWNDYPAFFKRGTYVARRTVRMKLSEQQRSALPEHHAGRSSSDFMYERRAVTALDLPPLGRVTNRAEVLFEGANPMLAEH